MAGIRASECLRRTTVLDTARSVDVSGAPGDRGVAVARNRLHPKPEATVTDSPASSLSSWKLSSRVCLLLAFLVVGACAQSPDTEGEASAESPAASSQPEPYVVEIHQADYAFSMPGEIPSGWITFRAPNVGDEHHVAVFLRLPEGVSRTDWHEGVAALNATGDLPEWWDQLGDAGGTGAVAPGITAQTTINMEPGLYGVLCGVIAPDGTSHWAHGMQASF